MRNHKLLTGKWLEELKKNTASAVTPIAESPVHETSIDETPTARKKNAPKVREIVWVQDGHSHGEQAVYSALWSAGTQSGERRLVKLGYREISERCGGMAPKNVRENVHRLIAKRSIEIAEKHSQGSSRTYWVYGFREVLRRWRDDGYTHVVKSRGAKLMKGRPSIYEKAIDETQVGVYETAIGGIDEMGISSIHETGTPSLLGILSSKNKEWAREKLKEKNADPSDIEIARKILEQER